MGSDVRVRLITGAHHLHRLKGADLTWMKRLPPGLSKTLELVRPDLQALIRTTPLGSLMILTSMTYLDCRAMSARVASSASGCVIG